MFHKRRRITWIAEWLLASHEDLCPMEFVQHFRIHKVFVIDILFDFNFCFETLKTIMKDVNYENVAEGFCFIVLITQVKNDGCYESDCNIHKVTILRWCYTSRTWKLTWTLMKISSHKANGVFLLFKSSSPMIYRLVYFCELF